MSDKMNKVDKVDCLSDSSYDSDASDHGMKIVTKRRGFNKQCNICNEFIIDEKCACASTTSRTSNVSQTHENVTVNSPPTDSNGAVSQLPSQERSTANESLGESTRVEASNRSGEDQSDKKSGT